MVLDDDDLDTWSAGSFFTNPHSRCPTECDAAGRRARFPLPDGRVKTSAAWLIERAGFGKGFGDGAARVSTSTVSPSPIAEPRAPTTLSSWRARFAPG